MKRGSSTRKATTKGHWFHERIASGELTAHNAK